MQRLHIRVMLLVVLASLLAACTGDGSRAEATPAPAAGPAPGFSARVPPGLPRDLGGAAITVVLGDDGPGATWENAVIAQFSAATGIAVRRIAGPQSSTERLAEYLQQWSAQSADVDVYMIDVIWPGIAAPHALDLRRAFADQLGAHFPTIVQNNTVAEKLVGMPLFTDAGLLLYRADLLQHYGYAAAPTTWDELEQMAQTIQDGERAAGNSEFWGFVWQGKAYEGLTCDALEWQVSHGGGTIIEPDGTVSVNNPQTIAALERAHKWIGSISPEGLPAYGETEALEDFVAGNAAFMRNWPYAVAVANAVDSPIRGQIGVAQLPRGDGPNARHAATLGGWQLMVSAYSRNQAAAIAFVQFMTSPEIQKSAAIERSLLPTITALYDDPDVLQANPHYTALKPVFVGGAVPRPSTIAGERYNEISTAYFTGVNQVLAGRQDAASAVAEIAQKLDEIMASQLNQP